MATANLEIGGRRYEMACREGEQTHLEALARTIDAKATEATGAVGGLTETRLLLLSALLLADELHDARAGAGDAVPHGLAATIEQLAIRIESLAAKLEKPAEPS